MFEQDTFEGQVIDKQDAVEIFTRDKKSADAQIYNWHTELGRSLDAGRPTAQAVTGSIITKMAESEVLGRCIDALTGPESKATTASLAAFAFREQWRHAHWPRNSTDPCSNIAHAAQGAAWAGVLDTLLGGL